MYNYNLYLRGQVKNTKYIRFLKYKYNYVYIHKNKTFTIKVVQYLVKNSFNSALKTPWATHLRFLDMGAAIFYSKFNQVYNLICKKPFNSIKQNYHEFGSVRNNSTNKNSLKFNTFRNFMIKLNQLCKLLNW